MRRSTWSGWRATSAGSSSPRRTDLLPIVDQFAGLGVKVAITEFDVDTDDLQLQADYTRDFMTAMFSDPNVTEISNFGIWANNIYNPRVALYNADWSPKPNGLVWEDLIQRQWHTSAVRRRPMPQATMRCAVSSVTTW